MAAGARRRSVPRTTEWTTCSTAARWRRRRRLRRRRWWAPTRRADRPPPRPHDDDDDDVAQLLRGRRACAQRSRRTTTATTVLYAVVKWRRCIGVERARPFTRDHGGPRRATAAGPWPVGNYIRARVLIFTYAVRDNTTTGTARPAVRRDVLTSLVS